MALRQVVVVVLVVQVVRVVQVVAQPQIQQAARGIPRQHLQAKEITVAYQHKHPITVAQWLVAVELVLWVAMGLRKLVEMVAMELHHQLAGLALLTLAVAVVLEI